MFTASIALVLSLLALVQGQVTVSQVVNMTAGDQYRVFCNPAGLTSNIRLDNTAFSVACLGTPQGPADRRGRAGKALVLPLRRALRTFDAPVYRPRIYRRVLPDC